MGRTELENLRMEAYENVLEEMKKAKDPEKLQQLSNAASQFEKSYNDKVKIDNEHELAKLKIEQEKESLNVQNDTVEKQLKFDKRKGIFESIMMAGSLIVSCFLVFNNRQEEDESYPKHPKTDGRIQQMLDKITYKKR